MGTFVLPDMHQTLRAGSNTLRNPAVESSINAAIKPPTFGYTDVTLKASIQPRLHPQANLYVINFKKNKNKNKNKTSRFFSNTKIFF